MEKYVYANKRQPYSSPPEQKIKIYGQLLDIEECSLSWANAATERVELKDETKACIFRKWSN